ncbi:MAG TPA: CpsD/CapB family tyrosine-protein kinase [Polyangia bacterium]|jgi:capsular exopolysaccharide synthesis family protein
METINESMAPNGAIIEAETYEPVAAETICLTKPRSAAAEQYRVLRYRLEVLARSGVRALAFTSAQSGEGKTTTAVNAALALGRGGRNKVVLVDADLRRPAVHKLLGLRAREGLCDVVAGKAALSGCLWRFGSDELYVLPAGNVPDDLAVTLYDPRLASTLAELRERFDFVLLDAPPVLRLADVPTLCRDLDGALLVVRAGVTSRELVAAAIDSLYGIRVHGIVLNDVDPSATVPLRLPASSEPAPKALPATGS